MASNTKQSQVGVVVIGRNEGSNLLRCLRAARPYSALIVYVDSASADNSIEIAQSQQIDIVKLSSSEGLTAARARNVGAEHVIRTHPDIDYIQFVDGDSELVSGWIADARRELDRSLEVAAVCGHIRERSSHLSTYNLLFDLQWRVDALSGATPFCGGTAMLRRRAFEQVGGFTPTLSAGEEADLGIRLRQSGWRTLRLDREMALHDANMTSFRQWWLRAVRVGYGYAEGAWLHRQASAHHWFHENWSILFWGGILPILVVGLAVPTLGTSLLLLLGYPMLALRVYWRVRKQGLAPQEAGLYAGFVVFAKFPHVVGLIQYHLSRIAAGLPSRKRASDTT